MPDQLRERFDALRNAVEHSDAAGLRDVRLRRTRRTRTRVAAATAGAVAALALGGVVVLPKLGEDATTSAGGAEVLNDSVGSDRDAGAGPTVQEAPVDEASIEPTPSEQATEDPPPQGPFSVTVDSLLTWEDIRAVGETGDGALPYGASLVFPRLCEAGSSYEQYSVPAAVYSAAWALSDGRLDQAVIEYETDQQAADALARLVQDSQTCPVYNEFASVQFVGSDASVGAEIVFFDLQQESGQDGSISTAEITVTRIANMLVEVVLTPDGPNVADGQSRSRALAEAAVSKVVAAG